MRQVAGFVAGATKCFALQPTVLATKSSALISRRRLLLMLALRRVKVMDPRLGPNGDPRV